MACPNGFDKPAYKEIAHTVQMKFQFDCPDFCLTLSYKPRFEKPLPTLRRKHIRYGNNGGWTAVYERVPAVPRSPDGWLPAGSI